MRGHDAVARRHHAAAHTVVMMQWGRWLAAHVLVLLQAATFSRRHNGIGAVLICRVIEKSTNVVDEKRVKKLGDSLLVREVQRTVKGYPGCC